MERILIDWETVEGQYRANVLSLRKMAKLHGTTESSIRRRAKKHGWTKDLSQKVRERAKERLASPEPVNHESENQAIEDSAAAIVDIVRAHQKKIGQFMKLLDLLKDKVRESIDDPDIPINVKASAVKNCIDMLEKLIRLERQAFNVDDSKSEKGETFEDILALLDEENERKAA